MVIPSRLVLFKLPESPGKRNLILSKRFSDWLPVPEFCHICLGPVALVRNRVLYNRDVGTWPFIYWCLGCGANAGVHTASIYPKGTLASAETKALRIRVHALFDPLWQEQGLSRDAAYDYLGILLKRAPGEVPHIGQMESDECRETIDLLMAHWLSIDGGKTTLHVLGFPDTSPEDDLPWS